MKAVKPLVAGVTLMLVLMLILMLTIALATPAASTHDIIDIAVNRWQITDADGERAQAFYRSGQAFAPVRALAEASGAEVDWERNQIFIRRDMGDTVPRFNGTTVYVRRPVHVGFQRISVDLPETRDSGVTWALTSISDDTYARVEGYELIPAAPGEHYDTRSFTVAFSRNIHGGHTFFLTFEQFLDGRPLHNFLVYEIEKVVFGDGGTCGIPADIMIRVNGRLLTDADGAPVETFIYNNRAFAPLRPLVMALGGHMNWPHAVDQAVERGSLVHIGFDTGETWPRIHGNTVIWRRCITIGFERYRLDLPETPGSGVIWEFVAIDDFQSLLDLEHSHDGREFVRLYGYEALPRGRGFILDMSRHIPDATFSVIFEQTMDGRRLGNFLVYEIHTLAAGVCWGL